MPEETVETSPFRRHLLVYLVSLFIFPLIFLLVGAVSPISPSLEESWLSPLKILGAFFLGSLFTFSLGRWLTIPAVSGIRKQLSERGTVRDNQSSLLSDFGFNLFFAALLGVILGGQYVCDLILQDEMASGIHRLLHCYGITVYSAAALAGLGAGYIIWLFLSVVRMEQKLNQRVMLEGYASKGWSAWVLVGIALVGFVVISAFYQLFTLGLK